jgi:hypothetical protein
MSRYSRDEMDAFLRERYYFEMKNDQEIRRRTRMVKAMIFLIIVSCLIAVLLILAASI